ncbi:HNH endonuclease signature motif containing protein [Fredinandcohnia humi]
MPRRYTKEQIDYIREIAPGRYNDEIAKLFNANFGTNLTEGQIKSFKANHKIKSNVPKRRVTEDDGLFTKEQKAFIKENVKGLSNQKLADLVSENFNLSITAKQMMTWKQNHGLSSGLKGSEGVAPPNKGTKGLYNFGGNKTSFKTGQRPLNYKPVGTERIDRDGYILIKVSDTGAWHERWKLKQVVIWEEANGPIPKGHCLLFLDGNKQNVSLDNLQLITRSQLARLNQNSLISNDPELTKTGIVIADIIGKIGERKRAN